MFVYAKSSGPFAHLNGVKPAGRIHNGNAPGIVVAAAYGLVLTGGRATPFVDWINNLQSTFINQTPLPIASQSRPHHCQSIRFSRAGQQKAVAPHYVEAATGFNEAALSDFIGIRFPVVLREAAATSVPGPCLLRFLEDHPSARNAPKMFRAGFGVAPAPRSPFPKRRTGWLRVENKHTFFLVTDAAYVAYVRAVPVVMGP